MSLDLEFYLKIFSVFIVSIVIFKIMMIAQQHKEDQAEKHFQRTVQLIGLRNKIYKIKEEK